MHAPRPTRALALVTLALCASSTAAQSSFSGSGSGSGLAEPTRAELDQLDLEQASLQHLVLPLSPQHFEGVTSVRVELGGAEHTLLLWPHSVRAPEFQLLVQGEDGLLTPTEAAPPATLRGTLAGLPESRVAASLSDGRLEAIVLVEPGQPAWGIQPLDAARPGASAAQHLVYRSTDLLPTEGTCGADLLPPSTQEHELGSIQALGGSDLRVCQIACDADYQFYQQNNSNVTSTEKDVEKIVNGASLIYEADAEVIYEVTTIVVRTSEPDPYSSSSPSSRLSQLKSHWVSSMGSVTRDITHLFTGVNLDGSTIGIAYLNVICSKNQGYGLSQSKYTGSLTARIALTAHELGHNWSSSHCDGLSDCKIMCSGLGGCGPVTSFGDYAKGKIVQKKNSSSCLSTPGPASLASVNPGSVQAFGLESVTIQGSNLQGVDTLLVGSVQLDASQFSVLSGTTISFTPPEPTALGSTPLVVVKSGQSSNAIFFDYAETDPPRLETPINGFAGQLHSWKWGAGAGDLAIVLLALDSTTFSLAGNDVLLNSVPLIPVVLGPTGVYDLQLTFPQLPLLSILLSQVVLFDGVDLDATNLGFSVVSF